jgi:hypothetical protein
LLDTLVDAATLPLDCADSIPNPKVTRVHHSRHLTHTGDKPEIALRHTQATTPLRLSHVDARLNMNKSADKEVCAIYITRQHFRTSETMYHYRGHSRMRTLPSSTMVTCPRAEFHSEASSVALLTYSRQALSQVSDAVCVGCMELRKHESTANQMPLSTDVTRTPSPVRAHDCKLY